MVQRKKGYSYFAKHIPTGEDWYLIGIDVESNRVCAAGYPPSIAQLSDCEIYEENKPLTAEELSYRDKKFGTNWM